MSKTLNKIKNCVEEGNYYEAHQMLVSVSQRLIKQNKTLEALNLLHQGVLTMLNAQQWSSALDMAERLISCLGTESSDDSRDRLLSLFCEFPISEPCCDEFIKMICKWSVICSPEFPAGDPAFHHAFGIRYYRETLNYEAESHLLMGTIESAKLLARLHFKWYKCQKSVTDPGYFLARIIFQYISLGKIEHACLSLDTFIDLLIQEDLDTVKLNQLSDREIVITSFPWITFSQLMLVTVQRGSKSHFKSLLNQFHAELSFDSFLKDLVYEHIGAKYFEMGQKKAVNPLQDIMKNLFSPQTVSKTLTDTDMD